MVVHDDEIVLRWGVDDILSVRPEWSREKAKRYIQEIGDKVSGVINESAIEILSDSTYIFDDNI